MKAKRTAVLAGATLFVIAGAASAVIIHVPGEEPTIQAGIDAASVGDTVLVVCNTYYEHGITMKSGITVMSETGDYPCAGIDCQGTGDRAFEILGVTSSSIIGFALSHGDAPNGGAIYADGSTMTIENCLFANNEAANDGGAVHWDDGEVEVISCRFIGNMAADAGGGLHINYSDGAVSDCIFINNQSGYGGGLCFEGGSSLSVTGSLLQYNVASFADDGGGGAYVEGGQVSFTSCNFDNNDGGEYGGGLYSYDSVELTCIQCTFQRNEADYGGGIRTDIPAWTTLEDCDFRQNAATDGGGAYFSWDPDVKVDGCTFTGNTVPEGGGGATCDNSVCEFTDCTFDENEGSWGAALAGYLDTDIEVSGSTFVLNRGPNALRSDGTIYTWGVATATIGRSVIAFNTAEEAVYCESGGSANLTCSLVYGNEGGDWTGCIEGQEMIVGNWHVDPRFCGVLSGDYTLCSNSDCLPENNPCLELMGAFGEGCGDCDSPVQRSSWGVLKDRWR